MRKIWQLIEFLSILPHLLKIKITSLRKTVVCERFLPDFAVWVSLLTKDPNYFNEHQYRILKKLFKDIDISIYYLNASLDELERRSNEDREFLSDQQKRYRKALEGFNYKEIDTTDKEAREVAKKITKEIKEKLEK